MEQQKKYQEELAIISKSDFIIDSNPSLKNASDKILKVLLSELKIARGAIIFYNPFEKFLNIISAKGRIDKKLVNFAFRMNRTTIRGEKIVYPISIRNKIFGAIFLAGKKFTREEKLFIKGAELVLDGRFSHEFETVGLRGVFEKYVDEKIIKKIIDHPDKKHIKGERHYCTVLFADINNFTKYSSTHKPETVINLLNLFYKEMSTIVFRYHGTVDKFIGDEIMVIFGSPIPQKDHAIRAIRAAIEMRQKIKYVINKYKIPKSGLSVGIATGLILAGDVGYERMMDYTVVGNKVNLASKLTGAAGINEILVDGNTQKGATVFKFERITEKVLKGVGKEEVYKLVGEK